MPLLRAGLRRRVKARSRARELSNNSNSNSREKEERREGMFTSETMRMSPWISCRDQLLVESLVSHSIVSNYYHISNAHLAANNPALQVPRRKPGQLASKFQTDKSGKLIITDDNSADEADPSASAGAAFMANVANTTADGTYRDSRGNLKFNRNTKRAREAEGDILRGLDEEDAKKENKLRERKKMRKQLGEEFRAKVCFPPHSSVLDADQLFLASRW